MAERILKCNCGCEIPVRDTQAGVQVQCPRCNTTLAVPSLRDLKNLPRAAPPPPSPWFAFLPKRSLPRSSWRIGIGIFCLAVAAGTPILIALGVLENAISSYPAGPRRAYFESYFDFRNPALWAGLFFLALASVVGLLRGLGYPIGGLRRKHS